MIYLLTAIGLSPGGSSTVHIYTQTIHRTIQNEQYIEQHNNWRVPAVPCIGKLYPGICLTTEEKARKTLSQGTVFIFIFVTPTYYLTIICNQKNASVTKTPFQVQFINTSVTIIFTYSNFFQQRSCTCLQWLAKNPQCTLDSALPLLSM
jgi:hypothetical protein